MGCVNTSSREFKALAAKNNVSPSKLELIVHKYWLQTGREDSFPTDIYIQSQLGHSQYLEPIESVRKLWQLKYSSPLEFSSLGQMLSAYGEAAKCFPKSAIFYYRNTDGKYILSIQQSVAKLPSKAEFFSNHDSMKSSSPLNLGLQEGRLYTVDKLQELYSQFNTDPTSKALASKVFSIAKDLGINVFFTDSIPDYSNGRYIDNNSVIIRKSYFENASENASKAKTILHELLHAVSSYALDGEDTSKELRQFKTEMTSLWQELKSHPFLSGEYGNTDVFEFVAELSNPVFRGQIQRIDRLNASQHRGIKSFWNRILNAFRSLLGLHTTDSYYQRSMNALDKALDAFDIDAYMRYNGIKGSFKRNDANSGTNAQLNGSLGVIDNAAKSGKWTPAALQTLYNLTDDIKNGKIRYQRFPSGTSKEGYKGSRANAAASLLLRANEGTGTENTRSFSESQRRREEERPVQEGIIEAWAKAAGLWHSNLDTVKDKKLLAEGGEAKVFVDSKDRNVVKTLSARYFITPQLALDRITLHNLLFPEAPLSVTGFGRNSKGEFIILAEQPFIQGEKASQSEIDQFITRAGFSKYERDNAHTFTSDDIYLSDLHDENVIKTPQGNLVVIDADLRLNTPDLGVGGKYVIDDRVVSAHDALAEDFIRSMSDAQRQEEADLIRQESADYDIINNNSMGKPKRKKAKAVPQNFTFADGTVVKAPFHPNAQQIAALNALDAFMKSNETSITLSGFAGTGKTSLMEMIARKGTKMHRNVVFSATTNKAAAVLGERVAKAGFKASTLNKVFGINVEVDSKASSYNARNLVNVLKDADVDYGSVVIIDEASMINEENYSILNDIAHSKGLKIIYVGDEAQLAPVGESLVSKVFRNTEGKVIRLTQVERTGDNAILREATDLRNGKPLSGISSFNAEGEGVAYVSPSDTKAINDVISTYVGGLKQDPNYFRILAFTNKAVSDYNQQVRHLLGYTSTVPQVGEPMTGYANWGYNYRNKSYRFINSESYRVVKVDRPKPVSIKLQNGRSASMEAIPLVLQDPTGHTDTFNFMDIKGNPQNKQTAILLAYEKKKLWDMARNTYGKEAKAKIYSKINEIESFLFVNDNIIDDRGNYLQTKTIDFGYALTVHKSQGSTFTNVLLDDVDIAKASRGNSMMPASFEEDSSQDGSQAEQIGAESVDLGDFSNVPDAPSNDKVADIRQQLEYVGVSRATDTVTIISDNVKREGSPLHPNDTEGSTHPWNGSLQTDASNNSSTKDTINPPASRSSNEVAAQLVSHLKDMGINVLGREAMQEYLSSHNLQYLQQMVSNYYMTVDNPSEVEVLRHTLFDKFKNKSSFGCIGRTANFWYLCDYFGDSTYRVRAQISIEGNERLLNDFEKAIRNESFRSTEDFSRRFEAFKSSQGEHYHGGTDAKITVSTNGNARMAGQQLQAEEDADQGGGNGQGSVYNAESQTEFLITPDGEVYGFVDKDGNIYLDETKISPEHPIHEYTHLWDRAVAKHNPELWNRGIELMKQTPLWQEVLDDDNYGKKWQAVKGMSPQKLDSLVASEVHSRFVGKGGAKLLDSIAKEKGQADTVSKLKQWILDVWKSLRATFSPWTKSELAHLTLTDFNHMTMRDFTNGINPMNASNASSEAGKKAIEDVYKKTFESKLVSDVNSSANTSNDLQRFNGPAQSGAVISSDRTILSNEELKYWNEQGVDSMPRILTASEHTDPAFHVNEVLDVINGKKSVTTWDHKTLTGKDFAGLYLITKHDGLPMKRILETKIPKLIHFSITGLGGTKYEPGVMKYNDLLDRIQEFINQGLDPSCVTIRIDPIVPGVTQNSDIENIVRRASAMGIKRIRFSVMDAYPNTVAALEKLGYDFTSNYGLRKDDKPNFHPKRELLDSIASFMLSLKEKYGVTLGTCAEPLVRDGISKEGCLSVAAVNNMLGTSLEDWGTDNNRSRQLCSCYGGKVDVLKYGANCASHCVYCYARHENDKALQYYNEDGSLKDIPLTRTSEAPVVSQQKPSEESLTDNSNTIKDEEPVSPSPAKQLITVKLPGYEYFNDLYEDSAVDAEWKIPYLKELDAQFSTDKPEQTINNIIKQMNMVFQATSEEEYLQDIGEAGKSVVDKTLDEYDRLNRQIDNLLDFTGYNDIEEGFANLPASEVRHAAEQIANEISDEITRLQTEKGRASKVFPNLNTKLDFSTASRREIVEAVGVDRLILKVKDLFDSEAHPFEDIVDSLQADLIFDNWDAMIVLGADVFALNEGFGITKDYSSKGRFSTTDESKVDYDNFNDYSNDADIAAEEGEKDEQEHWQIESKTIDVLNSMSALVRQGLHQCYVLDADGNKVLSKWRIAERVNPRKAVNNILRWTQGSLSLDDMVNRLKGKQPQNPWLSQLISRLSDRSGSESDFQSQFYSVFQKHFQLYSVVQLEDGKYHSKNVNSHPALSEAMATISSQYKIGELPLFRENRVNPKVLGSKSSSSSDFTLHKALSELRSIDKALKEGETLDSDRSKSAAANVMGVCHIFGYNVSEDSVSEVVNAENIQKFTEYLGYIVRSLDKALAAQRNGELHDYEPFGFGKVHGIDGSLRNFLTPITDVLEDSAVSAFYDSGKMYQSYVTPSFMSKLMNKFKLEGQEFEDFIMQEYGSSEWFKFQDNGNPINMGWRNGWLRKLAVDANARKVFAHKVELNFNKHNYMRNMTDAEYTLSLLAEYFSEADYNGKDMSPAWFRIPMQSNKPSSEFIRFYSFRDADYKSHIVSSLHDMFLQELSRIQTVLMRNCSKSDPQFIKNFDSNGRRFCFLPVFNAYMDNSKQSLAKRKMLHSVVEYDAQRLDELQQKEDFYRQKAAELSKWEDAYVSRMLDEDIMYEKNDDPVIRQQYSKLKEFSLSDAEVQELKRLKELKEESSRVLDDSSDSRFASLLQKKIKGEEALSAEEEVELGNLADMVLRQFMERKVQSVLDAWENSGILSAAKSVQGLCPSEGKGEEIIEQVRKSVENFLWNDAYASKNILQLTLSDIAFYKDTEELQKRLAQLHAPGMRGNVFAVDYKGKRVSDGKYRTFILQDFDSFKSNIIANISEVFDRRIAAAPDSQKALMIALKESLVGKDGKYTKINVTDAQGYSSPSSYRKKAFIFGRWSHHAEEIYQKLLKGEYTYTDLETAFQPLKPFVYSKLTKDLGVPNAPIHSMQVPFQAKNAEYLLVMADAILRGEQLSRPNLLRAVYRVMEDSERLNPTKGIDTVQFESAIKSGLQGKMNIFQFIDMEGGEEAAYTYMMNQIYKEEHDASGARVYRNYNTDTFVHEAPYEDYCLQQEVPEHFKEHSQAHGSQNRMITPSDLDFFTTDAEGNQVDNFYEFTEPDGTVRKLKADEFRKEYEQTIADNIEQSINDLSAELHLDSMDKRERNIALSKILQREVLSSPRYGIDLIQACAIDKQTGEFRIPKGDPIQAKRIEQLVNSVIKNRINKQKIAGGPIVQVSNFGTSQQLHIRFNDRKGNLIPLEADYVPSEHNGLSYKEYLKKNQGGIAYFEVFAPIWSNELFSKFSNADGSINVEAVEAVSPELLKMVSYRIPTEDKYSCAPMKVVGFMPREAGDAIMLPYELTEIDDSDFDVDKRYVMRKDIEIKNKSIGDFLDELVLRGRELYRQIMGSEASKGSVVLSDDAGDYVQKMVDSLLSSPRRFPRNSPFRKALYSEYQKLAYSAEAPLSGRQYRDNKIVDMTYAVLTNPMTADKILNPGGFDAPKRMGYMVAAYKNAADSGVRWSDLEGMSIDQLKELSYTDKDLTFADTQVQFYKQNSAAASLIGVFAVNKVAHATLESNDVFLDVSEICGEEPFSIAATTFEGRMQVDAKYDREGNLIGKTLGSLVSASADAVKDPILNLMNVNMTTAGMLNAMLRLGMTFNDAALFLSQDVIERVISEFNRKNLDGYASLSSVIGEWLDAYRQEYDINDGSAINTEPLSREELVDGLTSSSHEATDYKVLLAFQKLQSVTNAMRNITFATRFNSISSAVGPLIVDNLIIEHKMQSFTDVNSEGSTHFYTADGTPVDIKDVFSEHPVLAQFARTVDIAKSLFSDMPAGSTGFRKLLAALPEGLANTVFADKKLLDQFSNFYQSYLLLQSGFIKERQLGNYVNSFPKWFIEQDFKEKYPDNALLQAIRMNVSKTSKMPYLSISITGLDEQQKEVLKTAWIDLHKVDPELSLMLFNYCFFRTGVGFSPKTFMSLVPTYVKERLKTKEGVSYVDTYRKFPEVVNSLVIDQFLRNNWQNNRLVPVKGGKDSHYDINIEHGMLTVYRPEEVAELAGIPYIKTKNGNSVYLWQLSASNPDTLVFSLVSPLGGNGEYLEMSLSSIKKSLADTNKSLANTDSSLINAEESLASEADVQESGASSDLKTVSPQESEAAVSSKPVISPTESAKKLSELASLFMQQNPKFSAETAEAKIEEIKNGNVRTYAKFLQNVFKHKGLNLSIEDAMKEFKKYC